MTNLSNARYLGNFAMFFGFPDKSESGYTEKEETCKGCMGPCGQCEDGEAPEPDPEELPDMDWDNQPTEYDL